MQNVRCSALSTVKEATGEMGMGFEEQNPWKTVLPSKTGIQTYSAAAEIRDEITESRREISVHDAPMRCTAAAAQKVEERSLHDAPFAWPMRLRTICLTNLMRSRFEMWFEIVVCFAVDVEKAGRWTKVSVVCHGLSEKGEALRPMRMESLCLY